MHQRKYFSLNFLSMKYFLSKNFRTTVHCNYSHYYFNQQSTCKYLLCMKLQPTHRCSCSCYALMLLYVCSYLQSFVARPQFAQGHYRLQHVRAYTASDNAHTQTRVWPRETRSLNFMPTALPYGQFNPITSVLLSKSFSTPVRQFIT